MIYSYRTAHQAWGIASASLESDIAVQAGLHGHMGNAGNFGMSGLSSSSVPTQASQNYMQVKMNAVLGHTVASWMITAKLRRGASQHIDPASRAELL